MKKEEFLKKSDENILDYFISDTIDNNGNYAFDAFLEIKDDTICLTKEELKHLLKEIEYAEIHGPDYLND